MKVGYPAKRKIDSLAVKMAMPGIGTVGEDVLSLSFDEQIKKLIARDCPEGIIKKLRTQKLAVLAQASKISFPKYNEFFLPVIPGDVLSVEEQVKMIFPPNANGTQGICLIEPNEFYSQATLGNPLLHSRKTPLTTPYYILDVDCGATLLNSRPDQSRKILLKNGRRGLSTEEMISLAIHSEALTYHNLLAVASSNNKNIPKSPGLLLKHGTPKLCGIYDHALPGRRYWGTPSRSSLLL